MAETQISTIKVIRENLHALDCDCGGAYRVHDIEIHVDSSASPRKQREGIVHEILGAYLGSVVPTETLSEIAESIIEGLEQLEQGRE